MGLQVDAAGNFYYAKSARHGLPALVPHHGTLLRVSKDGKRTDILATGFRAANGVCINPDGSYIVTDQEGHWNPKNRINYVKEGGFYGNMYGYHDVTDNSDSAMEQPLVWITNKFDRSPGELLWVDSERWGPLNKRLLNLSYGYGMVYIVPHEKIAGQAQGGMCAFPIKRFPTGVMRGRFHPQDGQLYLAGMFAWAGSQQQPGGLYRLRYTGQPVHLPVELEATQRGVTMRLAGKLDRKTATDASRYSVKVWNLKRTKRYGSKHYDERALRVRAVRLDDDGRTLHLDIDGIAPTWCMEIAYDLRSEDGTRVRNKIHSTIHRLGRALTSASAAAASVAGENLLDRGFDSFASLLVTWLRPELLALGVGDDHAVQAEFVLLDLGWAVALLVVLDADLDLAAVGLRELIHDGLDLRTHHSARDRVVGQDRLALGGRVFDFGLLGLRAGRGHEKGGGNGELKTLHSGFSRA